MKDDMVNDLQLLLTYSDRNSMAHGIETDFRFCFMSWWSMFFLFLKNRFTETALPNWFTAMLCSMSYRMLSDGEKINWVLHRHRTSGCINFWFHLTADFNKKVMHYQKALGATT